MVPAPEQYSVFIRSDSDFFVDQYLHQILVIQSYKQNLMRSLSNNAVNMTNYVESMDASARRPWFDSHRRPSLFLQCEAKGILFKLLVFFFKAGCTSLTHLQNLLNVPAYTIYIYKTMFDF